MKPAGFSYEAPATLAEALAALARRREEAKVIAGGQSLAPMMNMRVAQPGHLIDINGIGELERVRVEDGTLAVGALVRHADLARDPSVRAHCPLLAHAASTIGHYAIRQRGTIGGSLAHADPAAQLPLAALALDAEIEVASVRGRRLIRAADFFVSIFTTALEADELVAAVLLPAPARPDGWSFRLFTRRAGDFALAAVAVTLALRPDGTCARLRIAAGGIGPVPLRLEAAAPKLLDPRDPAWAARIAEAVAAAIEVEEGERVPAAYRRELLAVLVREALAEAAERAR
jgi:aerobic carbon-monoxide dehydrogenase medium subunit